MISAKAKHPLVFAAAMVAAVAFACAGIAQLMHRAQEVHTVCAEHGERLHLAHTAGEYNPADSLTGAPDIAHGNDHELCGLCPAARHAAAAITHATNISAPDVHVVALPAPHESLRAPRIAVYRTAPKASPPLPA